ncbi:hypothetical protein BDZ89DRAFT_1259521 [Hymenopellis radicata]|nr:hypothetical protein BDZ89DRAFT_1259521 [Hymenopellis radicata]
MRVPLRLHEQKTKVPSASGEVEGIVGTLKDLNQMCFDYGREAARRGMCRIAAQTFVNDQDYGLAVSYCMSAEDWPGLGRLVDRVLDEYLQNALDRSLNLRRKYLRRAKY